MTAILTERQQHQNNNHHHDRTGSGDQVRRRRRDYNNNNTTSTGDSMNDDSYKAKLFLTIACCWPLALLVLVYASPQAGIVYFDNNKINHRSSSSSDVDVINLSTRDRIKLKFFNVLDRVDILGYGPTHPRVAVVIVGNDYEQLTNSYGSVLTNTDFDRLFVVCIVVDGKAEDMTFVKNVEEMNDGSIPHWHGLRPDYHKKQPIRSYVDNGDGQVENIQQAGSTGHNGLGEMEYDPHGKKVHVLFNDIPQGMAQSRKDAVDFIRLLELQHEYAGLKSVDEDFLLLFLQCGSRLVSHKWLQPVTEALIVPPPIPTIPFGNLLHGTARKNNLNSNTDIDSTYNDKQAMKLSNAVSFNLEGTGKVTSFDLLFQPTIIDANANDITASNGASYPTPAFNGAAIGMRLHTYLNLPLQDMTLKDPWQANIDLALNLWLCADGIDILKDVEITAPPISRKTIIGPFDPPTAARFAIAWMTSSYDSSLNRRYYNAYMQRYTKYINNNHVAKDLSYKNWVTYQGDAQSVPTFTSGLSRKCRSFQWFIDTIIPDWQTALVNVTDNVNEISSTGTNKTLTTTRKIQQKKLKVKESKKNSTVEKNHHQVEKNHYQSKSLSDKIIHNGHSNEAVVIENNGTIILEKYTDDIAKSNINNQTTDTIGIVQKSENVNVSNSNQTTDTAVIVGNTTTTIMNSSIDVTDTDNGRMKPSKPLCDECLRIVQKAQPIDISFVDVRQNRSNLTHPHLGAYDINGTTLGYVHNETALHLLHPPLKINYSNELLENTCNTHDNTWKMLHEKVFVDFEYDRQMQNKTRTKIFCLIYTTELGHHRIPAVRETWGKKCDGFMVASNKTDPSIDAVNIPHEGEESYNNIWQKVRSIWSYVYDNYYEKYDWFHIGGDDLFVLVENFRQYLESEEVLTASNGGIYLPFGNETVQTPLYLGRRFAYMGDMNDIFNSGGSGYTLNKAALKTLVAFGLPNYFADANTFSEDTIVGRILRNYGIYPYETKDEFGGERYMPFTPGHHYGYRIPQDHNTDWYAKYSINIKEGVDHCSARSVAFHYVKDEAMYRLYALLYKLCPEETMQSTTANTTAALPVQAEVQTE